MHWYTGSLSKIAFSVWNLTSVSNYNLDSSSVQASTNHPTVTAARFALILKVRVSSFRTCSSSIALKAASKQAASRTAHTALCLVCFQIGTSVPRSERDSPENRSRSFRPPQREIGWLELAGWLTSVLTLAEALWRTGTNQNPGRGEWLLPLPWTNAARFRLVSPRHQQHTESHFNFNELNRVNVAESGTTLCV